MKKIIDLYPEAPNEWLWRDHAEDVKREFYPSVSIPAQDEPLWHECTDMAKVDYEAWWERQHPQPEPEPEQEPESLEPEQARPADDEDSAES